MVGILEKYWFHRQIHYQQEYWTIYLFPDTSGGSLDWSAGGRWGYAHIGLWSWAPSDV